MFRNNRSGSQTYTQTTTVDNINTTTNSTGDTVIFAIVTGNINEVRRLVNQSNVDNIIDNKNRYTALHYAVKLPNNDIVEYLMTCGADPHIKQIDGKDSIDLSIEANKRFLINKVIAGSSKELDQAYAKLDDVKYNLRTVERKNEELVKTNNHLEKINSEYIKKIDNLKEENKSVKRKLDESEKAFENLLKKNKK